MSNYKIQDADYSKINKDIKIVIISAEFNREYTLGLEEKNITFLEKNGFTNIAHFLVP
jgi:6,7-dimethyl-8-ribityllumazine synthase